MEVTTVDGDEEGHVFYSHSILKHQGRREFSPYDGNSHSNSDGDGDGVIRISITHRYFRLHECLVNLWEQSDWYGTADVFRRVPESIIASITVWTTAILCIILFDELNGISVQYLLP